MIKRLLLLTAILLTLSPLAMAQTTTVSGTITDTNSTPYSNGTMTIRLINTTGFPALFGGFPMAQQLYNVSLDSAGAFSITIPSSTCSPASGCITTGGTNGTQWNFAYQSVGNYGAANVTVTVTGATQSLTATLSNQVRISWPSGSPAPPGLSTQVITSIGSGLSAWGTAGSGGLSGMTAGQVPIAATATTVTSSDALQGTDTKILTSGTVSGLAATLCVDALGGATTTGCSTGGLSGMTAGQVPIAATATTVTSSGAVAADIVTYHIPATGIAATASGSQAISAVTGTQFGLLDWATTSTLGLACTPPATVGTFILEWVLASAAAAQSTCPQVGLVPDAAAAATVTAADCALGLLYNPAAALSLPTPTTLANTNCALAIINNGSASTITPVTWTISKNGGTAASTGVVNPHEKCSLTISQTVGTQWNLDCGSGATSAYLAVTDASPIAWNLTSLAVLNGVVTLAHGTGTRALNISNPANGGFYTLEVKQDSTGGAALTGGTGCTWLIPGGSGGGAFPISTAASVINTVSFTYDGTNCLTQVSVYAAM